MRIPRITISGARGIVGEDMTAMATQHLAQVFGGLLGPGSVVVGSDGRPSGPMFLNAVTAGLIASGRDVVDLRGAPTPTVGLFIRHIGAAGGVMVTASHNPLPYNGLKFYTSDGGFVAPETIEKLKSGANEGDLFHIRSGEGKWPSYQVRNEEALELHITRCVEQIDTAAVAARSLRVAVDGCRSVGGTYIPALLRRLGCHVDEVDCQPDGAFTRVLEPLAENLVDLGNRVVERGADLGVAVDPDADRVHFVDETGTPIGEETGLALIIDHVLSCGETGPVAINSCTTQRVEAVAQRHGVPVYRSAVGELNVVEEMRQHNSPIGGEGNGGVMYPKIHPGRDAMAGTTLMIDSLVRSRKTLSALAAELPPSFMLKDKVELHGPPPEDWKGRVRTAVDDAEVDETDGVRFVLPGSWVSVRLSNTEPIIRLIAEAETREEVAELMHSVKSEIRRL